MTASIRSDTKIVTLLLKKGANPNKKDNNGNTALIWANRMGQTENVKLLLEAGANPNVTDNNGNTALMFASKLGHTKIVRLLKIAITSRKEKYHTHCLFSGKGGYLTKKCRNQRGCENVEGGIKKYLFNKKRKSKRKKSKRKRKKSKRKRKSKRKSKRKRK